MITCSDGILARGCERFLRPRLQEQSHFAPRALHRSSPLVCRCLSRQNKATVLPRKQECTREVEGVMIWQAIGKSPRGPSFLLSATLEPHEKPGGALEKMKWALSIPTPSSRYPLTCLHSLTLLSTGTGRCSNTSLARSTQRSQPRCCAMSWDSYASSATLTSIAHGRQPTTRGVLCWSFWHELMRSCSRCNAQPSGLSQRGCRAP